jgi:hypothetical protein
VTDTVPPIVRAWVAQLCDPQTVALLEAAEGSNVDVRLSAAKGKVRRQPVVTIGGGPGELVDPEK